MNKKTNKNKPPAKPTNEDSIDVSTANAENRFTWEDARKGITDEGGNASADVRTKGAQKSKIKKNQKTGSRSGNLGKTSQF